MLTVPSRIITTNSCLYSTLLSFPGKLVSCVAVVSWHAVSAQVKAVAKEVLSRESDIQNAITNYNENCINRASDVMPSPTMRGLHIVGTCELADLLQQTSEDLTVIRNSTSQSNYLDPILKEFSPCTMTSTTGALLLATLTDSAVDFCEYRLNCKKSWINVTATELAKWGAAALVVSACGVALQPGLLAYGATRAIRTTGRLLFESRESAKVETTAYSKATRA